MNPLPLTLALIAAPALAFAVPVSITDADTFRAGLDEPVRLKGWDGPEKGKRALCDKERELHVLAKAYAQELVNKADEVLVIIHPGEDCNWNRYCGDMIIDGLRYSEIMEAAGYLKSWDYDGGEEKPDWCG